LLETVLSAELLGHLEAGESLELEARLELHLAAESLLTLKILETLEALGVK